MKQYVIVWKLNGSKSNSLSEVRVKGRTQATALRTWKVRHPGRIIIDSWYEGEV